MRNDELYIEFPLSTKPRKLAEDIITPLPGRIGVLMDTPRANYGELMLPDELAGRTRPDAGTVQCVWKSFEDHNGNFNECPIFPGEKVLVRPYHGLWCDYGENQIRFYGVTTAWYNSIIARWSEELEEWVPMPTWFMIKRKTNAVRDSGLLIPNADSKTKCIEAEVILSSNSSIPEGATVLVDPHPNQGYRCRFQDDYAGCEFIQDFDYDGKVKGQRAIQNIWAVL